MEQSSDFATRQPVYFDIYQPDTWYVRHGKDLFEALIALVLLLSFGWLAVVFGFLHMLFTGQPMMFNHTRVGRNGNVFKMYKIRTLVYRNGRCHRSTVGRFMRRWRIDELPQLVNVLLGNMALIGPRPCTEKELAKWCQLDARFEDRLAIKQGITGEAQTHVTRPQCDEEELEKLAADLHYIEHCSFWLDLKLSLLTPWVIITGFNAV